LLNPVGILYVVATPIGNLEDITHRAERILAEVDLILAEDTRHSKVLLNHLGIDCPTRSYHDHNERSSIDPIITILKEGKNIALISDAGTPLINDPGYHLVASLRNCGVKVLTIPGPSAAMASLSIAGLPTDRFCFEGFAPEKEKARQNRFLGIKNESRTLVFFESGRRLNNFLRDAVQIFGSKRKATIAREMTKIFETTYYGNLEDLYAQCCDSKEMVKGEIVVIIQGDTIGEVRQDDEIIRVLKILRRHGASVKDASLIASEIIGIGKNEAYKKALDLQKD